MPVKKILVVRLGAMGDVIHALPAVATIKHSFPGCHLAWVIHPRWSALLEGNPYVDEVIHFDRHRLGRILSTRRALRQARFDMVVDFQGLIKSALLAQSARPQRIFGFHESQCRERLSALFYSDRLTTDAEHVVDKNFALAESTGATNTVRTFTLPDGVREGFLPDGKFVLASPLGGWKSKQWPLDYYGELAALIQKRLGMPLILNGAPDSADELKAVPNARQHFSSVEGLIDVTRRAAAVVGIDSGPLHLAAALEKPGVAIFGPTDPARNGPYGSTFDVLRSPTAKTSYKRRDEIAPSMKEISPVDVAAALARVLEAKR